MTPCVRQCISALLILASLTGTCALAQDQSLPAVEPQVAQAETPSGFVPAWNVGDSWTVEASYRDLRSPGEVWLPPIRWTFKVRAIKPLHRQDCYVVHVFPRTRGLKVQAILYLSTLDLRPLRVIDIFPTRQGVKHQERVIDPFQPQPLSAEASLVPYDLPLFPLIRKDVQRADGFAAYRDPEPRQIEKISAVAGFKFKKTIRQAEKKPDQQHADIFRAYRSGGETFQVELSDDRSGESLVQVWQEGFPWALSSESRARKVRLIPSTGSAAPRSGAPRPVGQSTEGK